MDGTSFVSLNAIYILCFCIFECKEECVEKEASSFGEVYLEINLCMYDLIVQENEMCL
jgi:hypothetical protein